ncbi:MAG: T9SS type A sorting domain-containing protein [Candidatus Pacebacteria bacterium]|nr:T9SS type A sorting domain-containing protein [Candidatus Paceibacterota bacterium]
MKSLTIILCIFLVSTIPTTGQELLEKVPSNEISPNDTLCYGITNPNSEAISFYPKIAHFPGGEFITYSEDSLYAWLNRQVTLQGEEAKLQMVNAVAYVLKSPRFINRLGLYDHVNGLGHKKYSSIGWFSNYHAQCGDYMRYGYHLLHNCYGVPLNELREFSITGEHTLGEIMFYGQWIKIDFDPGTPSFTTSNSASPNGFASIVDIIADTSLLVESERYLYADSLDLCPWSTMFDHMENFVGDTQSWPIAIEDNFEIEGMWTLCAGCKLEWMTPINNNFVFMDPNTPEYQEGYNLFVQYQMTGDPTYYLEAISMLADYLGITVEEAQVLLEQGLLIDEEVTLDFMLSERYDTIAPTFVLRIPPTAESLEIGRYGDVHLPFIVTSVETAGTVTLLDTVIDEHGFHIELWNQDSFGFAESHEAVNSEVNFLTEGWIDSPNGETVITLAFNPMIYPIGQVDIELHNVTFPGNLIVDANICNGETGIVTSLENENSISSDIVSLYPNPSNGEFSLEVNGVVHHNYKMYDTHGRVVYKEEKIAPGLYIVQVQYNDQNFIKKLIVQ